MTDELSPLIAPDCPTELCGCQGTLRSSACLVRSRGLKQRSPQSAGDRAVFVAQHGIPSTTLFLCLNLEVCTYLVCSQQLALLGAMRP